MAAGLLLVGLESMALNLSSGLGCRIWCLGFKVWRLGALGRGARNGFALHLKKKLSLVFVHVLLIFWICAIGMPTFEVP